MSENNFQGGRHFAGLANMIARCGDQLTDREVRVLITINSWRKNEDADNPDAIIFIKKGTLAHGAENALTRENPDPYDRGTGKSERQLRRIIDGLVKKGHLEVFSDPKGFKCRICYGAFKTRIEEPTSSDRAKLSARERQRRYMARLKSADVQTGVSENRAADVSAGVTDVLAGVTDVPAGVTDVLAGVTDARMARGEKRHRNPPGNDAGNPQGKPASKKNAFNPEARMRAQRAVLIVGDSGCHDAIRAVLNGQRQTAAVAHQSPGTNDSAGRRTL